MTDLDKLESKSIYILREAYEAFPNLCMLWSIGKDSTVLLWIAKKAFLGHVPFPLIHVDTHFKIPEMIKFRDELAAKEKISLIYGENSEALATKQTFADGNVSHMECCRLLKTEALKHTLDGTWPRYKFNIQTGKYELDVSRQAFNGVIAGIRADEEGSRSKERFFSPRNAQTNWEIDKQPPEFWNQYKTMFEYGTQVRIHPLLEWTELNIWEYIERENIPVTSLYFDRGDGYRYRSLGCGCCTKPIKSSAKNVRDIIEELSTGQLSRIAERSGRDQDKEDNGGLETLRKNGYM